MTAVTSTANGRRRRLTIYSKFELLKLLADTSQPSSQVSPCDVYLAPDPEEKLSEQPGRDNFQSFGKARISA